MSEMYYNPNAANVLTGGAHQSRLCPICKQSIHARKALSVDLGGGLETLVHAQCLNALDSSQPQAPAQARSVPAGKRPANRPTLKKGFGQITHIEKSAPQARPHLSLDTAAKVLNHGTVYSDGTIVMDADTLTNNFTPDEIMALAAVGLSVKD